LIFLMDYEIIIEYSLGCLDCSLKTFRPSTKVWIGENGKRIT
jgi:hypothetical protein